MKYHIIWPLYGYQNGDIEVWYSNHGTGASKNDCFFAVVKRALLPTPCPLSANRDEMATSLSLF
jgi:hypothetical protein